MGNKLHRPPGDGVLQRERPSVEQWTGTERSDLFADRGRGTRPAPRIGRVADQRMAKLGEMHPDLMRPPRL